MRSYSPKWRSLKKHVLLHPALVIGLCIFANYKALLMKQVIRLVLFLGLWVVWFLLIILDFPLNHQMAALVLYLFAMATISYISRGV